MSLVIEIESAIEKLKADELEELATWWGAHISPNKFQGNNSKTTAIESTSGCLSADDGEDFSNTVAAAGSDLDDSHEW